MGPKAEHLVLFLPIEWQPWLLSTHDTPVDGFRWTYCSRPNLARFHDEVRRIYAVDHEKPPFGMGALAFLKFGSVSVFVTNSCGDCWCLTWTWCFFWGVLRLKWKKSRCWTKNYFCIFVDVAAWFLSHDMTFVTDFLWAVKTWLVDRYCCWDYHSRLWNPPMNKLVWCVCLFRDMSWRLSPRTEMGRAFLVHIVVEFECVETILGSESCHVKVMLMFSCPPPHQSSNRFGSSDFNQRYFERNTHTHTHWWPNMGKQTKIAKRLPVGMVGSIFSHFSTVFRQPSTQETMLVPTSLYHPATLGRASGWWNELLSLLLSLLLLLLLLLFCSCFGMIQPNTTKGSPSVNLCGCWWSNIFK